MAQNTVQTPNPLRRIVVEDLGRDALVFTRYGLVLVDADAAVRRTAEIEAWLSAVTDVTR